MAERLVLRTGDLWFDLAPDLGRAGELALSLFQGLEVTSVRTERHEFRRSVEPVELKGLKYVEFRGRGAHLSISRSDMQLLLLADLEAGHPGAEIPSLRQAGEHWLEHWGCGLKAGPQVLVHLLDHAYRRPIPPPLALSIWMPRQLVPAGDHGGVLRGGMFRTTVHREAA